jgi:hypothetical protein
MFPAGFEPKIPESGQLHTHALDPAASGIGKNAKREHIKTERRLLRWKKYLSDSVRFR